MGLLEIALIAVGLAMDAFAVSLGVATCGRAASGRAVFRLAFHFGLFQALMPVIGWFAGMRIASLIAPVDHWIALGLLAFVGVRMIRSGLDPECESYGGKDPTRGMSLVLLAVATSIDALAVGLSLAVVGLTIWYPALVIGIITAGLSLVGVRAGNRLGQRFGKRMEIVGGVILCLIGLRIVLTHVFGL
jgi:putative Mn2+ efflux pump MntP